MFEREKGLFEIAKSDQAASPLQDHVDSVLLDRYVFTQSSLAADLVSAIESHLGECKICRELVGNIRKLPRELDDLIDSRELPLLNRLAAGERKKASIIEISRRVLWNPLVGYAAAAVILLTTVLFRPSPVTEPSPTIKGMIPSSLRGTEETVIFESPSRQCYLDLTYHIAPEAGHQYDIEVRPEAVGKPVLSLKNFGDFDAQGNAMFRLLVDAGTYRLVVFDIANADTLKIERPFEIRPRR